MSRRSETPSIGFDACRTAAQALWEEAERSAGQPCITDLDAPGGPKTRSYAELVERTAAIAGGMLALGLEKGDRVALLLHNSCAYVESYFGAIAAGLVVVPLNVRLVAADYLHMLSDSGSALLITTREFVNRIPALLEVPGLAVRCADAGGLEELAEFGELVREPLQADGEDPASLMYTSGTTGLPKAVVLSNRSWASVADTAGSVLNFGNEEVTLHTAPLTHGAGFLLLPTIQCGGHNLLCRSYDPSRTVRIFEELSVTGLFLVPSMIRMMLDILPEDWTPPRTLRNMYYAGSPIEAGTLQEATRRFPGRMIQSFAQMEAPMFFTVLDAKEHHRALADRKSSLARSAGRILPEVQLRIIDDENKELPAAEPGEVVVRAPQVMSGYWGRPEATASTLVGGWLYTGDIGYLSDDGHLYIVDRKKDMVVTGGSNVYAREVEDVLARLPMIADAAVIGLPDRIWGEAVTAIVVPTYGAVHDEAAVISGCRASLADYRVPKRVIWIDEIPRNAYGKVLKNQLRGRFTEVNG